MVCCDCDFFVLWGCDWDRLIVDGDMCYVWCGEVEVDEWWCEVFECDDGDVIVRGVCDEVDWFVFVDDISGEFGVFGVVRGCVDYVMVYCWCE